MKYRVFKVTSDKKQTLEFQLDVGEVRPGTFPVDVALDYVIKNVAHEVSETGSRPLMDSDGVHMTRWVVLDDTDIYWFLPTRRFAKNPEPVTVFVN